jgi:hypothetical protein
VDIEEEAGAMEALSFSILSLSLSFSCLSLSDLDFLLPLILGLEERCSDESGPSTNCRTSSIDLVGSLMLGGANDDVEDSLELVGAEVVGTEDGGWNLLVGDGTSSPSLVSNGGCAWD